MKDRKEREERIRIATDDLEKKSVDILTQVGRIREEMDDYYVSITDGERDGATGELYALRSSKRAASNLIKAYSRIIYMNDELSARQRDLRWRFRRRLSASPANSVVDLYERRTNHFARGLNAYKLLLLCFIGSFVGVVIELLWQFIHEGTLESRSGLVYGPFNLLYGAGAVALTVMLYRFRNHSGYLSFIGGMLVGSAVEYVCSLLQELAFGSRSWDYSGMPFNLNGRICLTYAFYWGILGYLWIKHIYPPIAAAILRIPERAGKIATWVLLAFFVVNSTVTLVSVDRWRERMEGGAPSSAVESFIDSRFPDSRMERIFANMEFQG